MKELTELLKEIEQFRHTHYTVFKAEGGKHNWKEIRTFSNSNLEVWHNDKCVWRGMQNFPCIEHYLSIDLTL